MSTNRIGAQANGWNASLVAARGSSADFVGIAELKALRDIDTLLPPELALEVTPALSLLGAADHLRLPPPPMRAPNGEALFRAFSSFVSKFSSAARLAGSARADALEAHVRLGTVARGIHGLELEIRERAARARRV